MRTFQSTTIPSLRSPRRQRFPAAKTPRSPVWAMEYDPRNLAVSPAHRAYHQQYDVWGRPIHVQTPYTYNQHQQSPPPGLPPTPPSFPPDQSRGGISIRGRAKRGRGKKRANNRDNPNLIDIPPLKLAAGVEYDPRNPSLTINNSNANDIPISHDRNRLRDRLSLPAPQPSLSADPSPERFPEPEPAPGLKPEPESPPKQHPLQNLLQQMAANGAPPTPTGPAATHGQPSQRTRRLPNHVQIADAYMFQQTIDERLRKVGVTAAREDALRLAGVQWIDQTRKALRL